MALKNKSSWHLYGVLFLGVTLICHVTCSEDAPIRLAAFNIQVFGQTKVSKPSVVDILVQIIRRYDIILVQEIRDKSGDAISTLLEKVNEVGDQYDMEISERLGRTSSKEQYAFVYRVNSVSVKGTYQYMDPLDEFEREPFAILFHVPKAEIPDFALVAIHTSPNDVVDELNHMVTVHAAITNNWKIQDVLIMGDLNADCGYLNNAEKKALLLRDSNFHWWINDDADTTVKSTSCAYDRFVMTGSRFIQSVVDGSAQVFHFDKEYGLDQTSAAAVSDHYPIEISLTSNPAVTSSAPDTRTRGLFVGFMQNMYRLLKKLARTEL